MEFARTLHGGAPWELDMPLIDPGGSANIEKGAALLRGTTTNKQGLIRAAAPFADFAGMCAEQCLSAAFGTVAAGSLAYRQVVYEPLGFYWVEWSQAAADLIANDVASATASAVTFTTAQTDDFDGGYIYVPTGTGLGQLRYIGAATTTVFTVGTDMDFTTTLDTTSDVLMISPPGTQLQDMETTARKFKGDNGNGGAETGRVVILANAYSNDSKPRTILVPADHGETDSLNSTNPHFWALVCFTNNEFTKID